MIRTCQENMLWSGEEPCCIPNTNLGEAKTSSRYVYIYTDSGCKLFYKRHTMIASSFVF